MHGDDDGFIGFIWNKNHEVRGNSNSNRGGENGLVYYDTLITGYRGGGSGCEPFHYQCNNFPSHPK